MTANTRARERSTGYEAVVFDNDGVIVEPTERARIVDAVERAFREFGVDPGREHAEWTVATGAGPVESVGDYGIDPERFWPVREDEAAAEQKRVVREGGKPVYDDTSALECLDARLGLVSNNQAETVEFLVDYHDLSCFETTYGREHTVEGAARRKPAPYYIEQALSDLGTTDAVYVGDSEKDVVAAHAAGVDSVFLRREHVAGTDLSVEPTYEVADLQELVEVLAGR